MLTMFLHNKSNFSSVSLEIIKINTTHNKFLPLQRVCLVPKYVPLAIISFQVKQNPFIWDADAKYKIVVSSTQNLE